MCRYFLHLRNGSKDAPPKLDDGGISVFNPGIGVHYDFRDVGNVSGFSFVMGGVYFRDCADRHMFTLGAGGRGRLTVTDSFSWDINLIPSFGIIDGDKVFLPIVTAGINYHFTPTFSTALTFAFLPAFNDQQSNLGLFVLNLAF